MKKKKDWNRIIGGCIFTTFLIPVGFLIYRIIAINVTGVNTGERSVADYALMLVQCFLGIMAMLLPGWLTKKVKLEVPSAMYMAYMLFLFCAIFLGEVRNFYYVVPNWDTILHILSGAMLGALGFSFVNLLNNQERLHMNLTPLFVAVFAFCFAVTLGALWEIYEFSFDGILGLNMQKFRLEDGTELIGRNAVKDTMKDIIVDCLGAAAMSTIGYLQLKYKSGIFDKILIRKTK